MMEKSNGLRPQLLFKRTPGNDDLPLPAYETAGAAAFDLRACVEPDREHTLDPGGRILIETGFSVAVPQGYELQVRPRSGLALKHGITVLNSPGTVDEDYRGVLGVCLANLGSQPFAFRRGDRIAQGLVSPVTHVSIIEAEDMDSTSRGVGGFGSTGIR